MASFSKFVRPRIPRPGVITERDLDIIEAILRYRFSPTSELVRLVGGNEAVTQRRLRRLWESGLINRWAFPGIRTHSEFHYYLDDRSSLELMLEHGRIDKIHPVMLEELANNREKDYARSSLEGKHMQLGFLKHQLQISRFHFMLEMASRRSNGQVELISPLFASSATEPDVASYLLNPAIILGPIWALPDRSLHTLAESENTSAP